jgi:signal transduction histidine kinase
MGWGSVPGALLDPWLPLAAWVALFWLAVRRPARVALAGAAVTTAVQAVVVLVTAPRPLPFVAALDEAAGTALTALVVVQFGQLRRLVVARRRRLAARVDGLARERAAAAAAERERLARDLHDAAGHHLSAVVVQSTAALRLHGTRPELSAPALAGAARSGRALLAAVRGLAAPPAARPTGSADGAPAGVLDDVLQPLCDGLGRLGGQVTLRVHGERTPLPAAVVAAAYRIVQEALTNAMRYAPGATVTVDVAYRPRALAITVANAPPLSRPGPALGGGRGVAGMRARAAELGGELTAGPDAAGGWSVRTVLPDGSPARRARRRAPLALAGAITVALAWAVATAAGLVDVGWAPVLTLAGVAALAGVYAAGAHARSGRSWLAPVGAGAVTGAVVGLAAVADPAEAAGPATVGLAVLWGVALSVWLVPVWALGVMVRVRRGRYGRRQQELLARLTAQVGEAVLAERRRVAAGLDAAVRDRALRLVRVAESHAATSASGDAATAALATVEADAREALAGLRRLLDALDGFDDDARARVPA